MDKTKTVKTRKTPTPAFAVISFLVIVAVLVALINLGVDTTMSVFIAALIAVVIALLLDIPWADVERTLLRVVSDCIPTFLIVIMVGMLVGIWMAGGTVPALMYYGMKLISPKILVRADGGVHRNLLRQRGDHGHCPGGRGLHYFHPGTAGHRRGGLRRLVRRQDVPSVRHHEPGLRCQQGSPV